MKKVKNRKESYQEDRKRNDKLNKSDRERNDHKLAGNYPPEEDIMYRRDIERVGQKGEEFSRGIRHESGTKGRLVTYSSKPDDRFTPGDINEVEEPVEREMERPVPKNITLDDNEDLEDNEEPQPADDHQWDVTAEDLQALGPKDISLNMAEDEGMLKNRVWPVDMAAKDLDMPTEEDDDNKIGESIGPKDEENDFYSLGGDRHEDDMEGKSR